MFAKLKTALVVACALGAVATGAYAHPKVLSTRPAVDGTVTGSPADIRIKFNEAIFPKFSGVEIHDGTGHQIPTGKSAVDARDKAELVVPVMATLVPGVYVVNWHAVSTDTHKVDGHFSFTVK
jgi:copper resistance protein C